MDGTAVNKLPDQKYVGRVHEEEDPRIEGNRLGRQLAHGHPRGGERKQRHGKQMREIEPHEARRRLWRVENEMMISPYNCDEEVADCVAQPCRPAQQKPLEGW